MWTLETWWVCASWMTPNNMVRHYLWMLDLLLVSSNDCLLLSNPKSLHNMLKDRKQIWKPCPIRKERSCWIAIETSPFVWLSSFCVLHQAEANSATFGGCGRQRQSGCPTAIQRGWRQCQNHCKFLIHLFIKHSKNAQLSSHMSSVQGCPSMHCHIIFNSACLVDFATVRLTQQDVNCHIAKRKDWKCVPFAPIILMSSTLSKCLPRTAITLHSCLWPLCDYGRVIALILHVTRQSHLDDETIPKYTAMMVPQPPTIKGNLAHFGFLTFSWEVWSGDYSFNQTKIHVCTNHCMHQWVHCYSFWLCACIVLP